MNIPIEVVVVLFTAMLGMQAWSLKEIINLKTEVAVLKARLGIATKTQPVEDLD